MLFLLDNYRSYIANLEAIGVQFDVIDRPEVRDLTEKENELRGVMLSDKDLFIKASMGFVSFLRSFKEHKVKQVFTLESLDLADVARSFFLPIVPRIKEFR